MKLPVVAIIGRPNVGKSTLFNRLTESRKAITDRVPGTTRDRNYGLCAWQGRKFFLADSPGVDFAKKNSLQKNISSQIEKMLAEADLFLFLLDGQTPLSTLDYQIAKRLRKEGKKIIPVINKIEKSTSYPTDLYELGFEDYLKISSLHGLNIDELLDKIIDSLPLEKTPFLLKEGKKIAVVGKPNVGKSSLINTWLGEERVIVHSAPGTTIDAIEIEFTFKDQRYILVDTAGVRRRSKIKKMTEFFSLTRTLKSIAEAEIVLLLISAPEGVTDGDKKILAEMEKQGKAGVVLFNKWDLIQSAPEKYFSQLQARVPFGFYPCFAISALTGEGVFKVFDLVEEVYKNYTRQISTSELNRLLEKITSTYSPPRRGKEIKIYYGVEKKIKPPTFVLFVNHPQLLPSIYLKYLEKKFREKFNLWGTPVRFVVRRRK